MLLGAAEWLRRHFRRDHCERLRRHTHGGRDQVVRRGLLVGRMRDLDERPITYHVEQDCALWRRYLHRRGRHLLWHVDGTGRIIVLLGALERIRRRVLGHHLQRLRRHVADRHDLKQRRGLQELCMRNVDGRLSPFSGLPHGRRFRGGRTRRRWVTSRRWPLSSMAAGLISSQPATM